MKPIKDYILESNNKFIHVLDKHNNKSTEDLINALNDQKIKFYKLNGKDISELVIPFNNWALNYIKKHYYNEDIEVTVFDNVNYYKNVFKKSQSSLINVKKETIDLG